MPKYLLTQKFLLQHVYLESDLSLNGKLYKSNDRSYENSGGANAKRYPADVRPPWMTLNATAGLSDKSQIAKSGGN